MQQNAVSTISNDDYQLIEEYQLGTPLEVHRLRPGYIRFMRWMGLFIILFGIIVTSWVNILGVTGWHSSLTTSTGSYPASLFDDGALLSALLGGLSAIIGGSAFLYTVIVQDQSERLIVCEKGLLHVKKKIRNNHVVSMYWSNIVIIGKGIAGLEYSVRDRAGQKILLGFSYKGLNELIAQIRQRSEEDDDDTEILKGYPLHRKELLHRSLEPTKGDKRLRIVFYGFIGLGALFGFIWMITGRVLFEWLMYGTPVMIAVVGATIAVWRMRKIVKHIKENTQGK